MKTLKLFLIFLMILSCNSEVSIDLNTKPKNSIDFQDTKKPVLLEKSANVLSSIGGEYLSVARTGNFLFAGKEFEGVEVYDTSDLSDLKLLSTIKIYKGMSSLSFSADQNYLFVGHDYDGFSIVDIQNPINPKILFTKDLDDRVYSIYEKSGKIFISNGTQGFSIYDIQNIQNPILLGEVDTPSKVMDILPLGDDKHLIIADQANGIVVYDYSNLASITQIGILGITDAEKLLISSDEQTLYYLNGLNGFGVADISDLSNPSSIFSEGGGSRHLRMTFNSAKDKVYIGSYSGLLAFDISNPATPTEILHIEEITKDYFDLSLSADEGYVFAAAERSGIFVIDLSKPPIFTGHHDDSKGNGDSVAISNDGTLAIYSDDSGALIYDTTDPNNFVLLDTFVTATAVRDVLISTDKQEAYILEGNRFTVLNISDPANPTVMDNYTSGGGDEAILSHDGNYVYVAGTFSFRAFNITDPNNIGHNSITLTANVSGIDISTDDSTVYISSSSFTDVFIIDVSTPTAPVKLHEFDVDFGSSDGLVLMSDNTTLIVNSGIGGFEIYDVTVPTNPVMIHEFNVSGFPKGARLSSDEKTLYFANLDKGIYMVDISDWNNLSYKGIINGADGHEDFVLSNDENWIYVNGYFGSTTAMNIEHKSRSYFSDTIETFGSVYHSKVLPGEEYMYISTQTGFLYYDIRDALDPKLVDTIPIYAPYFFDFFNDGNDLVTGMYNFGFSFYDLTNKGLPSLTFNLDINTLYFIKVYANNSRMIVSRGNTGLSIYDITNQSTPVHLGSYDTSGSTKELRLSSDETKVYANLESGGVGIYNISNPASITMLDEFDNDSFSGRDIHLSVDEKVVILSGGQAGLVFLDVSDTSVIKELKKETLGCESIYSYKVIVENEVAVVSCGLEGVKLIDISTSEYKVLKSILIGGYSDEIEYLPNRKLLIVEGGSGGMDFIDISDFIE